MNILECCRQFYLYENFYFCRRMWRNKLSTSQTMKLMLERERDLTTRDHFSIKNCDIVLFEN
jgi:hypothetical protein